eukprot:4065834-Prymnesium_polylepis.1
MRGWRPKANKMYHERVGGAATLQCSHTFQWHVSTGQRLGQNVNEINKLSAAGQVTLRGKAVQKVTFLWWRPTRPSLPGSRRQ